MCSRVPFSIRNMTHLIHVEFNPVATSILFHRVTLLYAEAPHSFQYFLLKNVFECEITQACFAVNVLTVFTLIRTFCCMITRERF